MPESFAAQDSDYLATHHRRSAAAPDGAPHAAPFLAGSRTDAVASPGDPPAGAGAAPAAAAEAPAPASAQCGPEAAAAAAAAAAGAPITQRSVPMDATAAGTAAPAAGIPAAQGSGSRGSSSGAHTHLAATRGIKRRGSDSCIFLMAADRRPAHSPSRKRRSLEAPPRRLHAAARLSAAPVACAAATTTTRAPTPAPCAPEAAAPAPAPPMPARTTARRLAEPARPIAPAPAPAPASAPTPAASQAQAQAQAQQAYALPPINRYTLRELKIQNILQNPRLRHEVLFEPKLEFRPNSSGQLAEAKLRAAMQYWAGVDYEVRALAASLASGAAPTALGVATVTMLVVELREIVAEMAEDSAKPEQAQYAGLLRERIDEDRIRQQLARGVFDAGAAMACLAEAMLQFAQPARAPAIGRLGAYVQRGRLARALRGAFDVLEAIKIDMANSSIEVYREYMRSTAVAFERSHFNLALRRGTVALADTNDWWRRALDDARAQGRHLHGLDAVFAEAARDLVLDDSQPVPSLFRMDEARIMSIRREAERLAIVGMVFLSFSQFLQMAARAAPSAGSGPASASARAHARARLDFEHLAAECLLVVPEGCGVQWTEPLVGVAPPADKAAVRGDVGLSQLVAALVVLAERALGRVLAAAEVAALERTLLRTARHEYPLREIVEERVASAINDHTAALAALNGKARGSECEAMPPAAQETLRRSMLLFLKPALSTLSAKIHAVVAHHWLVYKSYYATVSSAPRGAGAKPTSGHHHSGGGGGGSGVGAGGGDAAAAAAASSSSSPNAVSAR
ncbi:cAMP-mediated signaling protein sok1 [Coemansia javaensis]|uniref:cAMP-mediated signaling protein sok1 n=1 Tax=Coemansia javaensis TaxID=2761396 RepID=A0A9W8HFB8_9FUNG|nr:cAMP-mediated signaling protein sok1 [Coemansia javaensis]